MFNIDILRSATLTQLSIAAIVLFGIYLVLLAIHSRMRYHSAIVYCNDELAKLYFYGHRLNLVVGRRFFIRYREFVDIGFCAVASALMMLALKENHTSRIVRGCWKMKDGNIGYHAWVEFRYRGMWLAIDPCWLPNLPIIRRFPYHLPWNLKIVSVCEYDEFWSLPISQKFFAKLQRPDSSYLFYELWMAYGWCQDHETDSISECVGVYDLPDDAGFNTSLGIILHNHDKWLLTRRIFDEFMAKPTRKQAKAHTIRYYKSMRKKLQRDYQRFLAEQEDSEKAS